MLEKDKFSVRAYLDPAMNFTIRLFGFSKADGKNVVVDGVIIKEVGRFEKCNSFMDIEKSQAQVLMDDLWSCGIRPSEGSGSAGSLAATQRHLEDMRSVAFIALRIVKP